MKMRQKWRWPGYKSYFIWKVTSIASFQVQAVFFAISGNRDISKTKGGIRFQEYEKMGCMKSLFLVPKKCFYVIFFLIFENSGWNWKQTWNFGSYGWLLNLFLAVYCPSSTYKHAPMYLLIIWEPPNPSGPLPIYLWILKSTF